MAIFGTDNIIAHVRSCNTPYWKIYQDKQSKANGNFVGTADMNSQNLGMEDSMDSLRKFLGRLTPGNYLLSAYDKPLGNKGGIESYIEVERNSNAPSAISGTAGSAEPTAYIEGIGKVTLDNLEEAVEKKMEIMLKKKAEEDERVRMKAELADLKKQVRENETGFKKGLMSVGAVMWPHLSATPAGKELIGFVTKATAGGGTSPSAPVTAGEEQVGTPGADDNRMVNALERLSKDNPEIVEHIELLAKVKEVHPDVYEQGLESLKAVI